MLKGLGEQNAGTDLWNAVNNIYPPEAFERDPVHPSNPATMGSVSDEYERVYKKIHVSLLCAAVYMGKTEGLPAKLPQGVITGRWPIVELFEGSIDDRADAAEEFWDIIRRGMEVTFGKSWSKLMLDFELGEEAMSSGSYNVANTSPAKSTSASVPQTPVLDSGFPITNEPIAISGQHYRKLLDSIPVDVKRTPGTSLDVEEGIDFKTLSIEEAEVVEKTEAEPLRRYFVNGKQMKLVRRLFESVEVRWDELDKVSSITNFLSIQSSCSCLSS